MIDLLKANGPFRKANMHCHTTLSDGGMTAAQVKDWYKQHGYSIVAFTDHSKYAAYPELKDADFLPIPESFLFLCRMPSVSLRLSKFCSHILSSKDMTAAIQVSLLIF